MHIPLHKPLWGKKAERAVLSALRTGVGTADGPYTRAMREKLKLLTKTSAAIPVTSCTHAMETAVACLGAKTGDEIIVPSFTLASTATAVMIRGATPVFADIDPVSYSLDPQSVAKRITKRTVGIITVHYAGMAGGYFDSLLGLAKQHNLWLVEDAAHCIGSVYKKKHLGTFGTAGALSFHGTKNVAAGEGGAILTDDERLADAMEVFRSIGTDRMQFLAGKVSAYSWVGEGSSYMLSDILAALVNIQLDQIDRINKNRSRIASEYTKFWSTYADKVQLPVLPKGMTVPNWHIYALKFRSPQLTTKFITAMRKKHIEVSSHYLPLHLAPMGRRIGVNTPSLPVTVDVASTIVRMPIYAGMTSLEREYVITTAGKVLRTL